MAPSVSPAAEALLGDRLPAMAPGQQPLCAIVTPMGMLGYGFDERLLIDKLDELTSTVLPLPVAVIIDSGSTDSSPSKLALGTMTCPEEAYRRDLTMLVRAAMNYRVPVLMSSAGGDGSNEHVDLFVDMIKQISLSLKCERKLNVLAIYSEVSKEIVKDRLAAGQICGCGDEAPQLTNEEIDATPRLLAQIGPEPILKAMQENPDFDILVAGRAYDPAIYVAFCAINRIKSASSPITSLSNDLLGGFYHMGKIMECGGLCATPKSAGATALLYNDGTFDISPLDPAARCTPLSVAAHTLYEKSRPDILHGPGGHLDLTKTTYEQLQDGVSVRVRGADFGFTVANGSPYTVKLEGARVIGYRALFIGSFQDPILIGQIHEYLDSGKEQIARRHGGMDNKWKLDFHIYGAGAKRPDGSSFVEGSHIPSEVFIVGEILADSALLAKSIASTGRVYCSHGAYEGQMATSGNFAFGIGGVTEIDVGPCSEFSVYHLMDLTDGEESGHVMVGSDTRVVAKDSTKNGLFLYQLITTDASKPEVTASDGTNGPPATNGVKKTTSPTLNGTKHPVPKSEHLETLKDVAKVIRSKNAGPFQITFDVMFDAAPVYEAVKKSGILSQDAVAQLFGRPVSEVVWCGFFDQALAFKLTLPRKKNGVFRCSGGFMENDVHGSQQYMPLMTLPLSEELKLSLGKVMAL